MAAYRTFLVASLLLLACSSTPSTVAHEPEGTPSDPVKVCAKEGQNCVFSEGKLGVCTQKMAPGGGSEAAAPRFVCMSLH